MPELPEVETVRRSLLSSLLGNPIARVEILNPVVLEVGTPVEFKALGGTVIEDITRRGKYLLFHLATQQIMVVHLRMTGKLLFAENAPVLAKHSHLRLHFAQGQTLTFVDVRRFGRFWLVPAAEICKVRGLNSLALEPLDAEFSLAYWQANIKNRKKCVVKAALLDQHLVAGLGNIYADEVLFAAKIHPQRQVQTLTTAENKQLCQCMKQILTNAIAQRGTSFRDYVDGNNQKGGYQEFLAVFMKAGEPCPNCGTALEKIKVVGRSSYFCPKCQQK